MEQTNKGGKRIFSLPCFYNYFLTKNEGTVTICDFNINNSNRLLFLCYGNKDWGVGGN